MVELLLESAAQVLTYAIYAAGAAIMTALGLLAESVGVQTISTGEVGAGLWYVYIGLVALYVGVYVLGHQRLLPLIRRRRVATPTGE